MGSAPLERADPSFFVPSKWAIQAPDEDRRPAQAPGNPQRAASS
jgi:hypothetical protein